MRARPRTPASTLLISFWDVSLNNFPLGAFVHRKLRPAQAKKLVEATRANGEIIGVSEDDLLAPYADKRLNDHKELRKILTEKYEIPFGMEDFMDEHEDEKGKLYSANPLGLFRISRKKRLLVITCDYEMSGKFDGKKFPFKVAADSVGFHLFESVGGRDATSKKAAKGKA